MKKYLLYSLLLALLMPFLGTGKVMAVATGSGTETNPYNVEAACAAVAGLTWTSNTVYDATDDVYVKGKISRIANKGTFTEGGTYGNASFYISDDGTENGEFYCFRVLYLDNQKFETGQTDIKVGDEVVICGKLMNYRENTPETVSGQAYLYSLNGTGGGGYGSGLGTPSGSGTLADPYNSAAAHAAVAGLTWTSNTVYDATDDVYVKGKISRIANKGTFTEGGTYGNASFYISDDGTENGEFYCFRILYLNNQKFEEGQTDIKVGDEVVICGKLMNYRENTPETVSGQAYLFSLNEISSEPPAPEVVDITVEPADGSDIYEAYAAKVKEVTDAGNVVGNITINLADRGHYTISKTIIVNKDIKIGPSSYLATIDASGLEGNMIEMATLDNPTEWIEADFELRGFIVRNLKKALFFSNSKNYVFKTFTIINCIIEQAGDATTIDFTKGSTALELTLDDNTFYAPTATTKAFYSSQGGQKVTEYKEDATQTFTIINNTMYNLAKGKNFFSHRQSNQKWMTFVVNKNIFVDCGKSGQVIKGINGGQGGTNPTWIVNWNFITYDGVDTSASESTGDEAEPATNYEGIVTLLPGNLAYILINPSMYDGADLLVGDLYWKRWYTEALAINITDSEGGKVTASPSYAAEGTTITLTATPKEGYELESLTVKDGADAEVTVGEDNTFTMPATDVTVTATFKKLPVDVNITVESGKDIAAEVETAADGAPIKSINVTLEEGGTYTIGKSLSAQGNVIINGNGATIDASALTTPFVQMAELPTEGLNDKGAYEIDEVSFNDVTITGLPYQLFYANKQKYLITTLKVDNSVIGINGSKNKTIFDFNGGGNCLNLTVNNSTLWANPSNAQNGGFYSSQSGQSVQDLKEGAEQVTTISNSTIYNIASGKTTSTRRKNSQDWIKYVVKNSIIAESGKSGQFLKGLNAGQAGKDAEWTVDGNTFIFGGEVIEEQTVGSSAENIQNSLTSDPEFADAANGDFTVGESTEQAELETGDPRWLVEYAGGEGDATDLLAEIEEAKKLLKYSMPYYDENNEESPETEGKALVDAIRDAEEKAEGGTSQKKLDKMLEELKQAEIDYTTALMDYELAESEAILAGADPADELAAEIQRLYDTQDVVREDYSNQPKHIKNYADEIDKAQKAYLRKAIGELIPEAQALADNPEVKGAIEAANEALEGDSSEDLFDALNGLLEAMETATGIRGIEAGETDDAPVYNMGGQRVSNNAKGIVIKNGKKIIRK